MGKLFRFFWNIFYWTYSRGSWQWDLSCLAFLLIIFLTPAEFLTEYTRNPMTPDEICHAVISFVSGR